jgi:hypothetical protein
VFPYSAVTGVTPIISRGRFKEIKGQTLKKGEKRLRGTGVRGKVGEFCQQVVKISFTPQMHFVWGSFKPYFCKKDTQTQGRSTGKRILKQGKGGICVCWQGFT